ncbi:MAG TPA: hypothetical protein VNP04_03965, partial [Alphaproteobacteria bacterium]|nr:hypothetical protein [Alphaproteobacteria bacterium]
MERTSLHDDSLPSVAMSSASRMLLDFPKERRRSVGFGTTHIFGLSAVNAAQTSPLEGGSRGLMVVPALLH